MPTPPTGVYNIYDFGTPDPTGTLDASVAINAAATAAKAAGGGIVFIPPGTYAIQTTISLDNNVWLVGSDQGDTILTAMGNLQIQVPPPGTLPTYTAAMVANSEQIPTPPSMPTAQYNMGVRDLTFNGNASMQPGAIYSQSGATLDFLFVIGVTIERCRIYNCQNHAITVDRLLGGGVIGATAVGNIRIVDNIIDVMATPSGNYGQPTGNLSIRVSGWANVIVRNNIIGYNPDPNIEWVAWWSNDGIDLIVCSDSEVSGNQITYVTDGIGCDWGASCIA